MPEKRLGGDMAVSVWVKGKALCKITKLLGGGKDR